MADYRAALEKLTALGLIYPAFESRAEIARQIAGRGSAWPHDPDGAPLYPGSARLMPQGERDRLILSGAALRAAAGHGRGVAHAGALAWSEQGEGPDGETGRIPARPQAWGDVILARKETPTSYHLSVVVDDALQGVSDVVRGQDLFHATAVHRLLQQLLGLPQPRYHHHRLIRDEAGRKLSKSTRSTALRELRAAGATVADVRRLVGLMPPI